MSIILAKRKSVWFAAIMIVGFLTASVTYADDNLTDEEIDQELLPQLEPLTATVRVGPVKIGKGETHCTWVPGYYKNNHWILGHQDCRKFY